MKPEKQIRDSLPTELEPVDRLIRAVLGRNKSSKIAENDAVYLNSPSPDASSDFKNLLSAGQIFGPYLIHGVLGSGGFGVVYRATDQQNNVEVALKLPREDRYFSPKSYQRFHREPRLLKKLDHPSVIRLIDEGVINDSFYIATEYQHGLDLHEWMLKNPDLISEKLVIKWAMMLADALQHAYINGVVHRDLKPRNIIVVEKHDDPAGKNENTTDYIPKITDFGLAYSLEDNLSGSTLSGAIVGTLGYLPPEQVMQGNRRADIRGDIYALGIILAELSQGYSLRKPENLIDYILQFNRYEECINIKPVRAVVSSGLYSILRKCVASDPDRRYQNPGELYLDLERLQKGIPLEMRPLQSGESLRRLVRRNPVASISLILIFMFLMIFSINQILNSRKLVNLNNNLQLANNQILEQVGELQLANRSIRESQIELKRTAYDSALRLGYNEMLENKIESVHDILDSTHRMENESRLKLREFSWHYLRMLACRDYETHLIRDFEFYLPDYHLPALKTSYDEHIRASEKYNYGFGYASFYGNEVEFKYNMYFSRLNNQMTTVFYDRTKPYHWFKLENTKLEKLDDSGRYERIMFNRESDKFYYFDSDDSEEAGGNWQIKTEQKFNRTDFYFQGISNLSMSASGEMISGLMRLKPGSGRLHWIIYDVTRQKLIQTGIELSEKAVAGRIDSLTGLSINGKYATLIDNSNNSFHVYSVADQAHFQLNSDTQKTLPEIYRSAINENNMTVVIANNSGDISLWDIQKGSKLKSFPEKFIRLTNLGFLEDGRVYLLRAYSNRVWIWDPAEKPSRQTLLNHTDEVWSVAFDQQGQRLVSTGDDNNIRLWDLQTGVGKIIGKAESLVSRGRFSADGSLFACCDFSGLVQVWETDNWKLIKSIRVSQNKLRSLAWGRGNEFLVCVGNGNEICEVNLKTSTVNKFPVKSTCFDIVYSQDYDEFIVSTQNDFEKVLFFQFPGGKEVSSINLTRFSTRLAIDPKSGQVAVGFEEGGFGIISLKTHQIERFVGTDQSDGAVLDVVFSPDGKNIFTGNRGSRTLIFDMDSNEKVGFIESNESDIHAMAFSTDGRKFATGDMSGKINVLQLPDY